MTDLRYNIHSNIITNSSPSSFQLSWNDEIMNITDNINEENNPIELKLTSKNHDEYIVKKLKGTIRIAGNINNKDDPIELKLAPKNHDEYIVKRIQAILKTLNIKGKIKIAQDTSKIISSFKLLNQIESLPLKEIIKPAMKSSDNLVFDSIYLTVINYNSSQKITDWTQGNDIIKQLIKQHFIIDTKDSLFVDGSGLSRYNRIQPAILFSLLKKAMKSLNL